MNMTTTSETSQMDSKSFDRPIINRPRAHTTQLGPLQIPILHSPIREIVDGSRHNEDEDDGYGQDDAHGMVGVSISRAQTHILSPTTPAAEKSAALDSKNAWGFFDSTMDEEQEGMIRDSLYEAFVPQSHPDTPPEEKTPRLNEPTTQAETSTIWAAEGRQFQVPDDKMATRSRSRAGSAAALLGDLNIRRFIPGLLPSAKSTPRSSRPGSRDGSVEPSVRIGRSNTIFGGKMSWASSLTLRPSSRDPSPGRSPGHRRLISSPMITDEAPKQSQYSHRPNLNRNASQIQRLKRSASHDSIPYSALSRVSSLDDNDRFAHIDSQVNTRVKAIRDTITDNLPAISTLNFGALKPEFSFNRTNTGIPRAISTVFSAKPHDKAESAPSSPSKASFTNPRYPFLEGAMDNLSGDVVVLGGYRGSTLRSAEPPHRQVWAPIKIGLNMRNVDLEVGLEAEDEENMEERIFPSGMLTHVGPIDISRRLITRLRKCKNSKAGELRVADWGYDWRLSPALLSKKLIAFLEKLQCNQPGVPLHSRGATVIAHSLGGLITRKAINDRPDLFAGVIFVGTPQFCVNILGPFRNGDDVLLSSKILTAQVNFTLRTSFVLLPESGQCFIDIDNPQTQYHVDFFNVETWKKYAFSPCISKVQPALSQAERRSFFGSLPSFNVTSNGRSSPPEAAEKLESKAKEIVHPDNALNMSMSPPPPAATACTIPLPDAIKYLERTLQETLAFKKALHHREEHQNNNAYPPMSVLYSTSLPTVYGAKVAGRDGIARADAYDNLAFASGDGVVLARAAMLPRGYKCAPGGRVRTERGHVGMLGDLDAVGKCLLAVIKSRRKGVGMGPDFALEQPTEPVKPKTGDGIGAADGRPF